MRTIKHLILYSSAVAAAFVASEIAAQDHLSVEAEATFAAARFVIEHEPARELLSNHPGGIVVDTEFGFGAPPAGEPLTDQMRHVARRLLDVTGGRSGTLKDLLVCDPAMPTPSEERLPQQWRCRLKAGTDVVFQVSEPEIVGNEMYVWVGWWGQIENRTGPAGGIYGRGQKVLLVPGDEGSWKPSRIILESSAHLGQR